MHRMRPQIRVQKASFLPVSDVRLPCRSRRLPLSGLDIRNQRLRDQRSATVQVCTTVSSIVAHM